MNRLALVLFPAAAFALAGCGAAGCTSAPAELANPGQSCTVAAGSTVSVSVAVNCKCTDTSASCQAEWLGDQLEVAPSVQQCSDEAGCDTAGCDVSGKTASCSVTIPATATAGSHSIVDGSGANIGTVNVSSSGSGCSL